MRKILTAMLCVLLTLAGCKRTGSPSQPAAGKTQVAATIFPLADIISKIGGDKVQVTIIMPPGSSPHTFEVRPETISAVRGSKAIFKIGSGLDDWSDRIASSLGGIELIDMSKNVPLRKFEDGSTDPHYWLAAANAKIIAENVASELTRIDPNSAEHFKQNLAAYANELETLDKSIRQKLSALPNKNIVTFHEAWFYFADAYGLKVVAAFEPFPGREPSPAFLSEFIGVIKKNNVKVIFSEPQFSPDAVRQVADDLGVKLETLDPEGGATKETSTYIGMMQYNADKIYESLK